MQYFINTHYVKKIKSLEIRSNKKRNVQSLVFVFLENLFTVVVVFFPIYCVLFKEVAAVRNTLQ